MAIQRGPRDVPRAVPPWLHRVCIRRFGPDDPWKKLLLYTINAFMDDAGETDVGQQAIATAASMGVSTVREKTAALSKDGWLALYTRGQSGRKWKSYFYRACVPDAIDLESMPVKDTTADQLANHHEAVNGEIEPNTVRGTLYPQRGKRRAPPARGGSNGRAPPAEAHDYRQGAERLPPVEGAEHRQRLGGKFLNPSSSQKVHTRKGAAEAAPLSFREISKTRAEDEEAREAEEAERKYQRIKAHLVKGFSEAETANLLRMHGITAEEVRKAAIAWRTFEQ